MENKGLKGSKCVGLFRCSTKGQVENSIGQQRAICKKFAAEQGMEWCGEEKADGVSGYQTEMRDDIQRVLALAKAIQASIVVVQDWDRLTRGGADHGSYLLWLFAQSGLRVVAVRNDIPDNEYGPVIRAIEFMKGQKYSETTAFNTARGRMAATLDGRAVYCGEPPFGVDRLYFSASGEKLHRLRNLADGTQVMLHPHDDSIVLGRFARNAWEGDGEERKFVFRHYMKQPHERMSLVPGAPERVEVARFALHRFYVDGIGSPTITYEINKSGWPAGSGGEWNITSLYRLVNNPIYTGRGVVGLTDEAEIYNQTKTGPRRVADGERSRYRSEEDWVIVEYPSLQDPERAFLSKELQDLVWPRQRQRLRDRANGVNRRDRNDSHHDSTFVLKDSIQTTDGYRMRGYRTGRNNDFRYYINTRSVEKPTAANKGRRKMFPADAIEQAVIDAVCTSIGSVDIHIERLRELVNQRLKAAATDGQDHNRMIADRALLEKKLSMALDEMGDLEADIIKKKIATLKAQLRGLNDRIAAVAESTQRETMSVDSIVGAVADSLRNVMKDVKSYSSPALRRVLSTLTMTTINLDSREAMIEVRLPVSALADPTTSLQAMCPISPPLPNRRIQTHQENAFVFDVFRCTFRRVKRKPCLACQRVGPNDTDAQAKAA